MSRLPVLAIAPVLLAACQNVPSAPDLEPLEEPRAVEAAPPRVSGVIPVERRERAFTTQGVAEEPVVSPPPTPGAGGQAGDVTLNFVDTDIREIARTILGTTLKLNYTIDPNVHGTGSIDTGTPLPRSALLPTLETLLNANGATLVERNGVYAVVPIAAGNTSNAVSGANAIGAGTQVVALRYAAAKDLAKVLEPYVAEGGKITADPGRNALLVSGDAAVRQTLVRLIRAFDIDILAGQSYALFPVGDSDPTKFAGELEKVFQAQGEGPLGGLVRVLPMERVNAVLVVSSQPRYIDAARRFVGLMNRVEDATARAWHVYYVQNGQSADLELLLQRAFTPRNVSPTAAPPGTTAPGAAQLTIGGGAGPGGNVMGFGGQGSTSGLGGAAGGAGAATGVPGAPGGAGAAGGLCAAIPAPTAAAEAAPPATEPLSTETGAGAGGAPENRMRIIANRRNNALLIYATPSEYTVVEGMLRKLDIIPLQVLIEATIAEVDLNDQLQYGTQFFFKVTGEHIANTLGPLGGLPPINTLKFPSTVGFFTLSKQPNFALSLLASVSKVKVLSAPQVMVLDNEPARLQVGQQVPVLTGQLTTAVTAVPTTANSVDYHSTGVIMLVTPRVNSGGLVTLDIAQEVSDVAATPAVNSVAGSPTFNDQTFRTRVAVQDGQTVGMAGLIRDNVSNSNAGIPFLKDIPILGTLVSTQLNSRMRTELLVLITPHVVHDQRDARALTEDLRSQLLGAGLVPQQLQRTGTPGVANPNGL